MIVAVSGMAGSGKGSVSRLFAAKFDFCYVDFGLLFRFAVYALQNRLCVSLDSFVYKEHLEIPVGFEKIFWSGNDLTAYLRGEKAAALTADYVSNPAVFTSVAEWAQDFALRFTNANLICDGRSCGLDIFPKADAKFFLACNFFTRASRRWNELRTSQPKLSFAEVCYQLRVRDSVDRNREFAPARKPYGAITIDTTKLTVAEVVAAMGSHV